MAELITLADVKTFAGISSNNSDTQINNLIPVATSMIRNYCGRNFVDFYDTPKTEVFSGGAPSLFLTEVPVRAVSNIEYSSDYGQTYATLVEYTDYAYNSEMETIDVLFINCFPKTLNGYKVTYTGGYETAPADLKQAAIDIVQYYMKSDMAVKSTRSPGSSATQVEYVLNATLPSHIRRVLDSYRLSL
jgi:hypothetical protein